EAASGALAIRLLHRGHHFGEPGQRQEPRQLDAETATALAAEEAPQRERLVDEMPDVRMGRVEAAEAPEELAGAQLQASGKIQRRGVRLFDLDAFEREAEVRVEAEVGVDRGPQRHFELLQVEAGPGGVVGPGLTVLVMRE